MMALRKGSEPQRQKERKHETQRRLEDTPELANKKVILMSVTMCDTLSIVVEF